MTHRKFVAEALGTAVLVMVGVGVATLSFGFKLVGTFLTSCGRRLARAGSTAVDRLSRGHRMRMMRVGRFGDRLSCQTSSHRSQRPGMLITRGHWANKKLAGGPSWR